MPRILSFLFHAKLQNSSWQCFLFPSHMASHFARFIFNPDTTEKASKIKKACFRSFSFSRKSVMSSAYRAILTKSSSNVRYDYDVHNRYCLITMYTIDGIWLWCTRWNLYDYDEHCTHHASMVYSINTNIRYTILYQYDVHCRWYRIVMYSRPRNTTCLWCTLQMLL